MPTIFSKIIEGEIPAYKVAESNDYLAFLDINPLVRGHVLVIPKRETDYLFDMEDDDYMGIWGCGFLQKLLPGVSNRFIPVNGSV